MSSCFGRVGGFNLFVPVSVSHVNDVVWCPLVLSLSSRWASVSVSLLWQSVQQERRPEDAHPHPHTSKWQGFSNFCVYKLFVYSPLLLTAALFNHGCISWTRLDTIWWFRCTDVSAVVCQIQCFHVAAKQWLWVENRKRDRDASSVSGVLSQRLYHPIWSAEPQVLCLTFVWTAVCS